MQTWRGGEGHERVLLMMPLGASHFINYTEAAPLIQQGDEQALPLLGRLTLSIVDSSHFFFSLSLFIYLLIESMCVFCALVSLCQIPVDSI